MKRVLYAEDSVASQALMRRYLKDLCEVVIAPTPRAASSLLGSETFSALITDYMFADCDASDLIVQARKSKSATELPIVVVSSSMDKVLATRLLSAGANDVAAKPLHPGDFRALVQRMLEQPYVCKQELRSACLPTLQWQAGDMFHEFCPEFGLQTSGTSAAEASRAMQAAIQARIAAGATPGQAHHAKLATHLVEF
jgi:PleD family two-component response regulator